MNILRHILLFFLIFFCFQSITLASKTKCFINAINNFSVASTEGIFGPIRFARVLKEDIFDFEGIRGIWKAPIYWSEGKATHIAGFIVIYWIGNKLIVTGVDLRNEINKIEYNDEGIAVFVQPYPDKSLDGWLTQSVFNYVFQSMKKKFVVKPGKDEKSFVSQVQKLVELHGPISVLYLPGHGAPAFQMLNEKEEFTPSPKYWKEKSLFIDHALVVYAGCSVGSGEIGTKFLRGHAERLFNKPATILANTKMYAPIILPMTLEGDDDLSEAIYQKIEKYINQMYVKPLSLLPVGAMLLIAPDFRGALQLNEPLVKKYYYQPE